MEDKEHVLFVYLLHNKMRTDHPKIFSHPKSVFKVLNHITNPMLYKTATVLLEIRKMHMKYKLS